MRALEDTIARHGRRERWSRCVPAPAHRHGDLERRISEADAYLQIMIDLINVSITYIIINTSLKSSAPHHSVLPGLMRH